MLLKKFIVLLGFLAIIMMPANYLEAAPRVAVIPFDDQSTRTVSESDMTYIMKFVQTVIVQTKKFDPCNRSPEDIKKVMAEIRMNNTSAFDQSTASKLGRLIGAQYLVLGTVTELSTKKNGDIFADVSLQMIEVETARIYLAGMGDGKSKDGFREALKNAAKDALNGEMGMLTMMRSEGK